VRNSEVKFTTEITKGDQKTQMGSREGMADGSVSFLLCHLISFVIFVVNLESYG
jgi:hypothetical protein